MKRFLLSLLACAASFSAVAQSQIAGNFYGDGANIYGILPASLRANNSATGGYLLAFDATTSRFYWTPPGSGSGDVLASGNNNFTGTTNHFTGNLGVDGTFNVNVLVAGSLLASSLTATGANSGFNFTNANNSPANFGFYAPGPYYDFVSGIRSPVFLGSGAALTGVGLLASSNVWSGGNLSSNSFYFPTPQGYSTNAAAQMLNIDVSRPAVVVLQTNNLTITGLVGLPAAGLGAHVTRTYIGSGGTFSVPSTWRGYGAYSTNGGTLTSGKAYVVAVKVEYCVSSNLISWAITPSNN